MCYINGDSTDKRYERRQETHTDDHTNNQKMKPFKVIISEKVHTTTHGK